MENNRICPHPHVDYVLLAVWRPMRKLFVVVPAFSIPQWTLSKRKRRVAKWGGRGADSWIVYTLDGSALPGSPCSFGPS